MLHEIPAFYGSQILTTVFARNRLWVDSERRDSECSFYTCMWTKNFVIHSILLLVLRSGPFLVTVSKCVYISFTPTRCRKTHIKQDKHVRFISTLNKLLNSRVFESLNSNGMAFHVTVHYM